MIRVCSGNNAATAGTNYLEQQGCSIRPTEIERRYDRRFRGAALPREGAIAVWALPLAGCSLPLFAAKQAGCIAVIVDAKDEAATRFVSNSN